MSRTVLILDASPGAWSQIARALLPQAYVENGGSHDIGLMVVDSAAAEAVGEGLARAAAGFIRAIRLLGRCPRDPLLDGHWDNVPTSFAGFSVDQSSGDGRSGANGERASGGSFPDSSADESVRRATSASAAATPALAAEPIAGDVNVLWAGRRSVRWAYPADLSESAARTDPAAAGANGRTAVGEARPTALSWISRLTSRIQSDRSMATEVELIRSVGTLVSGEQAEEAAEIKKDGRSSADVSMVDAETAGSSGSDGHSHGAALSGALSTALSFLHTTGRRDARRLDLRGERAHTAGGGRILVVTASREEPEDYVAFMNCAFAAEKLGVTVDVCVLEEDRPTVREDQQSATLPLLLQVAHLTDGAYLKIPLSRLMSARQKQDARASIAAFAASLLQVLVQSFLATAERREMLFPQASAQNVDLRTSCFCHGLPLEHGFVCSVCLSVFCKAVDTCSSCKTKFSTP